MGMNEHRTPNVEHPTSDDFVRSFDVQRSMFDVRRSFGFTLVELLVVIAILTVLAAFLLPMLQRARATAQEVACMSNLRQFSAAVQGYADDSNGWCPAHAWPRTYPAFDWTQGSFSWHRALSRYLGAPDEVPYTDPVVAGVFACPGWDAACGYGWNNHACDPPYGNCHPWRRSALKSPEQRMLMQDTRSYDVEMGGRHASATVADWYYAGGGHGPDSVPVHAPVAHGGRGPNCLFGDLHVGRVDALVIRVQARPHWLN